MVKQILLILAILLIGYLGFINTVGLVYAIRYDNMSLTGLAFGFGNFIIYYMGLQWTLQ
jgi:membrane-associated protease RseP (regulator of RpoE activity)